jgi:ribosomal protein S18 acetylase RimI-like enzyme
MSPVIRSAGPGDSGRLSLLGGACFLAAYADSLAGDDLVLHCARHHAERVYADWLVDPTVRIWLAETERGAPIGYLVMTEPGLAIADPSPADIEVLRLYVLPGFQGAQIGETLLATAIDAATAMNRRRMLIGVYGRNERGLRFYRRMGFEPVGRRRFLIGQTWCDDIIVARRLTAIIPP